MLMLNVDCWCSTVHGVDYICLLEAAYNQLITAMNRAIPVAIAVYRCVQVTSWNQLTIIIIIIRYHLVFYSTTYLFPAKRNDI